MIKTIFKKSFVYLSVVMFVLVVFQVALSNHLATKGREIEEKELITARLEQENRLLRAEIAGKSSLNEIAEKAGRAKFVENPDYLTLSPDGTVALRQ